jgi:carbon-monoxide dehydrogenase large subunit
MATEKVVSKARAVAAHMLKVEAGDLKFDEGVFSTSKTNRTLSVKEIAVASLDKANLPNGLEPGLFATAVYQAPVKAPLA